MAMVSVRPLGAKEPAPLGSCFGTETGGNQLATRRHLLDHTYYTAVDDTTDRRQDTHRLERAIGSRFSASACLRLSYAPIVTRHFPVAGIEDLQHSRGRTDASLSSEGPTADEHIVIGMAQTSQLLAGTHSLNLLRRRGPPVAWRGLGRHTHRMVHQPVHQLDRQFTRRTNKNHLSSYPAVVRILTLVSYHVRQFPSRPVSFGPTSTQPAHRPLPSPVLSYPTQQQTHTHNRGQREREREKEDRIPEPELQARPVLQIYIAALVGFLVLAWKREREREREREL
ncbi:hypothetical protein LY76DRAFT_86178 [Colletotrichum caudatum]|nr:hypothetical protein LY76DRAFT_86178 [Colletotrichum caudatum]